MSCSIERSLLLGLVIVGLYFSSTSCSSNNYDKGLAEEVRSLQNVGNAPIEVAESEVNVEPELKEDVSVSLSNINSGGITNSNATAKANLKIEKTKKNLTPQLVKDLTKPSPAEVISENQLNFLDSAKTLSLSLDKDWEERDVLSQIIWKDFSSGFIRENEVHVMNVSYTGIHAATTFISILPSKTYEGRPVYHFNLRAKTANYYKWIYALDDTLDTYVDKELFIPWKYSLIQRQKNKNIDDVQLFNRRDHSVEFKYKKEQDGKVSNANEKKSIPFFSQDYFSSFFFLRGMPLKNGDEFIFPTTTKGQTWLMNVKVLSREDLRIGLGKFKAVKVQVTTKYTSDLAKKGSMYFWLTDDSYHIFLKTEAEVKIGFIRAELVEYSVGSQKILYSN